MKGIYANVGEKLCKLAKFFGFVGIVVVIVGLAMLIWGVVDGEDALFFSGPAAIASGIGCIIGSWPLYAFGQITTDIQTMRNILQQAAR